MKSEPEVRGWAAGLGGVVDRIAPRFGHAELRRHAGAVLHGCQADKPERAIARACGGCGPGFP